MLSLCAIGLIASAQKYESTWESIDSRPVPSWFEESRFGIFIHWGVYSVPGWATVDKSVSANPVYSEWYWWQKNTDAGAVGDATRRYHSATYGEDFKYQDFAKDFEAEYFDPGEWADLIKASGARYVVLTSKHHEGFALWPSAESWNWNSVDIGPHRDLCGELSAAVKECGLRMGFYYSLYEWYNPIYLSDVDRYVDQHMLPQLKDLVNRYEPDMVWTDGEWDYTSSTWRSTEFLAWLYNESAVRDHVVVNDRWGCETRGIHGGFYTTEYDLNGAQADNMSKNTHPWEECRGIGNSFGYNRAERLEHYSTSRELVVTLIERVARGGNLLLDIGPKADGTIPLVMQERLLGIGRWMDVNGEAIYCSKPWHNEAENKIEGVYFTAVGRDLYVHITKPCKSVLLKNICRPTEVSVLGGRHKVSLSGTRLVLSQGLADAVADMPCVVKLAGAI